MSAFSQEGFRVPNDFSAVVSDKTAPNLPPKPRKRIVICCDGTWQSAAHGNQSIPSNIAKITRSICNYYIDENGLMAPQIVYYDAGVGTAVGWLDKQMAGNFGAGLDENVCEAYNFIVNNYSPGDSLFFFGFSRGAYTARACAGLVCRVGICKPSAMNQFWEMYANYQTLAPKETISSSLWGQYWDGEPEKYSITVKKVEKTFWKGAGYDWLAKAEKDVCVKVVGVFDTVGSLGVPENVWFDVKGANKPYAFHNTEIHPQIENAFHALALEEHRKHYSPTLWSLPPGSKTNLIQCWFPGVHINIGGGSGDGLKENYRGDLEMMSITTLMWMIDRCHPFLRFSLDPNIATAYHAALTKTIEKAAKATDAKGKSYGGWGVGPVIDLYNEDGNWLTGSEPRTPGHYFLNKEDEKEHNSEGHQHKHHHEHIQTNEFMHPVIAHAIAQIPDYSPPSLSGFVRTSLGPGEGYVWEKTYHPSAPGLLKRGWSYIRGIATPTDDGDDKVSIPEWVIPMEGESDAVPGLHWQPLERWLVQHAAARVGGYMTAEERAKREDIKVDQEGLEFLSILDTENAETEGLWAWKAQRSACTNPKYPVYGF